MVRTAIRGTVERYEEEDGASTVLGAFASAFRTPDLRKKLLFVLLIVVIFRLGSQIPTPGVNVTNVQNCFEATKNSGIYGLINLFSGGALLRLTIFALGIMPYITASIILQLLVVVIPRLETLKKDRRGRPRSPSTPDISRLPSRSSRRPASWPWPAAASC